MPAFIFHAGRLRSFLFAGTLGLIVAACFASPPPHRSASALGQYARAQKMREALEGRPERQRTRRDYERVMDSYRAVYHSNPASPRADASVSAVADLLAEEGRVFQDSKALHDAISQYEFLRANYPQSHYRYSALLTMGEVYLRDLNDRANAKSTFEQFLKAYPQSPLAAEARIELSDLRPAPHRGKAEIARAETPPPFAASPAAPPRKSEVQRNQQRVKALKLVPQDQQTAKRIPADQGTDVSAPEIAGRDIPPAKAVEPRSSDLTHADLNANPPPRRKGFPLVTGIRHWSTPVYTRVAIDLQEEVQYEAVRVPKPDRIFFDLHGTHLSPELIGKSDQVIDDGFLKQIRVAQSSNDVTRIVLDVSDISEYSAFFLPNPPRLIIDVHGTRAEAKALDAAGQSQTRAGNVRSTMDTGMARGATDEIGLGPIAVPVEEPGEPLSSHARRARTPDPPALEDLESLGSEPDRVRATARPTRAPVAQSVAGTDPAPQPDEISATRRDAKKSESVQSRKVQQKAELNPAELPADGQPTLVRTLGLKINRIVVDAGHGGHDSGTLGPGGIEEKNVALDVALRLGTLLKRRLGADVIYTRDDDTFIPLETRTAIANKAQADLFISIHANSSPDPSARGVETYYLNFTTSADALQVAARENAVSDQSIHQLSDLVKKIALQDKINESREFATDVEQNLYSGLENGNAGLRDRGVKKAPFVVLIGANMPSILAEISFLTNPEDATELRQSRYRERIAESLYRGVARYVDSLSGVRLAEASPHSPR